MLNLEVMMNPEKHGYKECPHCNGWGSSLKDPVGIDKCTVCHGVGLIKDNENNKEKAL